jgi:chloramphenicol 3-O phosphotransferase
MQPGTIIFLNGTTSSGKSTILSILQDTFPEPFLDAGIDKFLFMLPARFLEKPLWDDVLGKAAEAGAHGKQLMSGMHRSIAQLAAAGNNVLADHVFVEEDWARECAALFADRPAYLVGIHCPLNMLELREKGRADRTLGQARKQLEVVHKHTLYDLELDTHMNSIEKCVLQIVDMVKTKEPTAFKRIAARFAQ